MHTLFITRKYPPQVGGMEQFSYGLINHFPDKKKVIALTKSQQNLWWWLPYATILGIIKAFSVDVVHLGDVVLAPVGYIIKLITRKPVTVTAHGLDVVYQNKIFKKFNIPSLLKLDKVICISEPTRQECLKRGVNEKKLLIIPNGVDVNKFTGVRTEPAYRTGRHRSVPKLITVGRLVKRKGVNWFVRKVMPKLEDVEYLIAGSGSEQERIEASIKEFKLEDRVRLLGRISDEELINLYNSADIFVMPNLKVKGDREGFGIVLLEAASVGLPIVASGIEGIKDAITHGKNGYLVESGNSESFVNKINEVLNIEDISSLRAGIKQYTQDHYSWDKIALKYKEEFEKLV